MTAIGDSGAAHRPAWVPPVSWFPDALLIPSRPLRSIAVGWLLAFPASIVLAMAIHWIAPAAQGPKFVIGGPAAIGMLVFFSPILETLIMGGVLLVLLRFLPPSWAVIASALGWGIAHSLAAPVWGMIIWWPFLIFSTLFVAWRRRSLWLAFAIPMTVHALQNLGPALLIAGGVAV